MGLSRMPYDFLCFFTHHPFQTLVFFAEIDSPSRTVDHLEHVFHGFPFSVASSFSPSWLPIMAVAVLFFLLSCILWACSRTKTFPFLRARTKPAAGRTPCVFRLQVQCLSFPRLRAVQLTVLARHRFAQIALSPPDF